jgi:hypothetical protein
MVTETPVVQTTSVVMHLFVQYLLPVIFSGLAGLLSWVFVQVGKRAKAQAGESKVTAISARLAHFGDVTVADLEATLKPELIAATKDGELTRAEILHLRDVALTRLKVLAGQRGAAEIHNVLGIGAAQVDEYLRGVIERAVDRLPRQPSR